MNITKIRNLTINISIFIILRPVTTWLLWLATIVVTIQLTLAALWCWLMSYVRCCMLSLFLFFVVQLIPFVTTLRATFILILFSFLFLVFIYKINQTIFFNSVWFSLAIYTETIYAFSCTWCKYIIMVIILVWMLRFLAWSCASKNLIYLFGILFNIIHQFLLILFISLLITFKICFIFIYLLCLYRHPFLQFKLCSFESPWWNLVFI